MEEKIVGFWVPEWVDREVASLAGRSRLKKRKLYEFGARIVVILASDLDRAKDLQKVSTPKGPRGR